MHKHNMKYSQRNGGRKGNRLTPAKLEHKLTKEDSILTYESSELSFKQIL
jgi:hypothetical protein